MTPAQTARENLTDYEARVVSRVIMPMQATPTLLSGTRQFRGEVWHREGLQAVDHGAWTKSRGDAFAEGEALLVDLENSLEKESELEQEAS